MRVIVTLAAAATTACLMSTAVPAGAATHPAARAGVTTAGPHRTGAFVTHYRGHHIMGWGRDDRACAYIDGVQLVLYPLGTDRYLSALQAFKEERGVRAITEASVRVLGDFDIVPPADPVPHCPEFVTAAGGR
ncbi:hypothetical protein [Actinoplanes xinjiangensis]|uniref:hypothetical protein n=1 Tax=Actinoplanes xinjiangensis TaxID=512350 RepID=UPI003442905A